MCTREVWRELPYTLVGSIHQTKEASTPADTQISITNGWQSTGIHGESTDFNQLCNSRRQSLVCQTTYRKEAMCPSSLRQFLTILSDFEVSIETCNVVWNLAWGRNALAAVEPRTGPINSVLWSAEKIDLSSLVKRPRILKRDRIPDRLTFT